jgi:mRNA-degrading endonuclease RelE of RelBE toxin-antitoxin system
MKKLIFSIFFLFAGLIAVSAQADQLISKCALNAGADAKYLKDFRVQLGKGENQKELRYKANMSLWKNTKYRFSMCNADNSGGRLILTIKDETNKVVLTTYDNKTGKIYASIDFTCNKSGIYQLSYDFENWQQGSGVGIVSMVR